ncbi:hypothetical protein WJX73_005510 [Symbiochloris irregularis]|uniref:Uncharacterized protein n=1 Tax=Symbiochloris irregularis TaxID=706552 RepID=A0AAW1P856_9CHLO
MTPLHGNNDAGGEADTEREHPAWNSVAVSKPRTKERKRGISWTETEHKQFLTGLQQLGKGDWRGISQHYVKTRTPTQVASHAQKHFIRRLNAQSHKRRSSLFDMETDSEVANQATSNPPSQRNSLEQAEYTASQGPSWRPSTQANIAPPNHSRPAPSPPQPIPEAGPDMNDYRHMMQMHAAAAAGYTLGNQYAGAVMPAHDSPGGSGMGMMHPTTCGTTQQQMAAWYAAASAASMAAQAALANHPADMGSRQSPPSYQSGPPFPYSYIPPTNGTMQRPHTTGFNPPYGEQQQSSFNSRHQQGNVSLSETSAIAAAAAAAAMQLDCTSGSRAWGRDQSYDSVSHITPAMPCDASLGLGGSRQDDSAMDASSSAEDSIYRDAETSSAKARPLIKPKATLAQASSATQAGFGCEPLFRSLATISKAGSAATTSDGSGKSTVTLFDTLALQHPARKSVTPDATQLSQAV